MPFWRDGCSLGAVVRGACSVLDRPRTRISRYEIHHVEIYASARTHGIDDLDINHAIEHRWLQANKTTGKCSTSDPTALGTRSRSSRYSVTTAPRS